MNKMKIFEPAMCCPTGLCGVGVDPELLRISTVLDTLKKHGANVFRLSGSVWVSAQVVTRIILASFLIAVWAAFAANYTNYFLQSEPQTETEISPKMGISLFCTSRMIWAPSRKPCTKAASSSTLFLML